MNQKTIKRVMLSLSCLLLIGLTGCEFNAPTPAYYKDYANPAAPSITKLNPDKTAPAGTNIITIQGENFSTATGGNKVYFGGYAAELVSQSATSILVRRPNITGAVAVSVTTLEAIQIARYSPYTIDTVVASYGGYVENTELTALTVDQNENVYVFRSTGQSVIKMTPAGEKTVLGTTKRVITDATVGKDGSLIMFSNNPTITKMNTTTGAETDWGKAGKRVTCGDFDQNGVLYTAGRNTDLVTVKTDASYTYSGLYAQANILEMRVYNNFLYMLVEKTDAPTKALWKHEIKDATGKLGDAQLVLDLSAMTSYSQAAFKDFTFSQDGIMYFGTDNTNPVIMVDQNLKQDILYKGIIPASANKIVWGRGNSMYMIQGGAVWDVLKIGMGAPGAPYYGR